METHLPPPVDRVLPRALARAAMAIRAVFLTLVAAVYSSTAEASSVSINDPNSVDDVSSYVAQKSPESTDICIIGVYETRSDHGGGFHPEGTANVHVQYNEGPLMIPLVLVLSSYEPTRWYLKIDPGAEVSQIILNGYHPQEVENAGSIPIVNRVGPGNNFTGSAIRWGSADTNELVAGVESLLGAAVTSFSGVYRATDFTVHGSAGSTFAPTLAIASVTRTPAGVCLTIPRPTASSRIGVEYSPSMSPGSWIELGNFFLHDGGWMFIDPDPVRSGRPSGFYRAFLRPAVP